MKKLSILPLLLLAQPAFAEEATPSGLRAELRAGYQSTDIRSAGFPAFDSTGSGATIGVELGYDLPLGTAVTIGPFVNYDYNDNRKCLGTTCLGTKGNWQAGARLGLALDSRAEVYAKAGFSQVKSEITIASVTGTDHAEGLMGAIGMNYYVGPKVYVGAEFNYSAPKEGTSSLKRYQGVVTLGTRF
ncbi:MAG: porin family protein [Novosphingobium sp.]